LTVAGDTTSPVTNVTVNTSNSVLYADVTFASTNQPWVNGNNIYTAIAKDVFGRLATNASTVNLQATNAYVYDLNGNLTTNGSMVLDWDDENELIRITQPSAWKTEFTYDGKMRRRIRKEFTWTGSWVQTNEVHYIWDGNVVVQERDTNNNPVVTYTRGTDLSGSLQGAGGIGGLLARSQSSLPPTPFYMAHSYYHADGNGNITMLLDASQNMVGKYLYGPFGDILSMSGVLAPANTCRFSSMEYYDKADVLLYLYRPYFVGVQRWGSRDPIEEKSGYNLYTYVANDSIGRIDSLGLWTIIIQNPDGTTTVITGPDKPKPPQRPPPPPKPNPPCPPGPNDDCWTNPSKWLKYPPFGSIAAWNAGCETAYTSCLGCCATKAASNPQMSNADLTACEQNCNAKRGQCIQGKSPPTPPLPIAP